MSDGKIIHFIQRMLYEGWQQTDEGYYLFTRKELAEGAKISVSTVDRYKDKVLKYFSSYCDLKSWAQYNRYAGENLYIDVSYQRGKLKFKRNPITLKPHLSHLWALPPLADYFCYDEFDKKHRRRTNSNRIQYDAIPWQWDADLWEQLIAEGKADRLNAIIVNPPEDSLLLQQAKSAYSLMEVVLLQEGYSVSRLAFLLSYAVQKMFPELCEFLILHGADPNEIIYSGYSPLQAVNGKDKIGEKWEKVVRILIDAGGDLTWGGFTPIAPCADVNATASFAANIFSKGSGELCRYYINVLHEQGLLEVIDNEKQTPLSLLKIYKENDIELITYMERLLQHGGKR